jgi:hypothetical protein
MRDAAREHGQDIPPDLLAEAAALTARLEASPDGAELAAMSARVAGIMAALQEYAAAALAAAAATADALAAMYARGVADGQADIPPPRRPALRAVPGQLHRHGGDCRLG